MREHRGSFRLVHARHSLYIIIYIRCACAVCVKPKAQAKCVFYAMCGRVINTYLYCTDTQHVAKWPISRCKTAHFAVQNGPYCNAIRPISQTMPDTAARKPAPRVSAPRPHPCAHGAKKRPCHGAFSLIMCNFAHTNQHFIF